MINIFYIILVILFAINVLLFIFGFWFFNKSKQTYEEDTYNYQQQYLRKEELTNEISQLMQDRNKIVLDNEDLKNQLYKGLEQEKDSINRQLELYKENTNYASDKYFENLELKYKNAETTYKNKIEALDVEFDQTNQELKKLKDTLAASIQARIKEKKIKDNLSFYCLQVSDVDKLDIQRLEQVKKTLNKPRVLSMLIWQTWFQKPLKALSANVLGTKTITGIYKITNVETGECYVGQAVDVATRWSDHAKCGLGIDTPSNNKLYQAMQEYGLWSFSWELLEECPRDQLNEKEKYYINLYDSYNYGMNSNKGVGK
jgi:hypothetical protein